MILEGDCLEKLKELEDNSVDSIVTDPPYGLEFMGKDWDKGVPGVHFWVEMIRVLKPGGHLLAFSGTRTYHRMAVAIEDAGFEVRDMIEWVYGSGFPKSLNIGKAVDKLQGNEREVVREREVLDIRNGHGREYCSAMFAGEKTGKIIHQDTKGTSKWEGWGTALKPSHEPICMARKPLAEKSVAENCLKWGTGGINIDESRVEATDQKDLEKNWTERKADAGFNGDKTGIYGSGKCKGEYVKNYTPIGRFPANLIHDNSEEVTECFPNESGRFFKSIIYQAKASKSERNKGCEGLEEKAKVFNGQSDKSSTDMKDVEKRFTTLPKANNHPTVKPIALMEYLIKMVTPKGGTVLDPFAGSGSTLVAAKENGFRYIGIELTAEYIPIIKARLDAVEINKQERLWRLSLDNR